MTQDEVTARLTVAASVVARTEEREREWEAERARLRSALDAILGEAKIDPRVNESSPAVVGNKTAYAISVRTLLQARAALAQGGAQ